MFPDHKPELKTVALFTALKAIPQENLNWMVFIRYAHAVEWVSRYFAVIGQLEGTKPSFDDPQVAADQLVPMMAAAKCLGLWQSEEPRTPNQQWIDERVQEIRDKKLDNPEQWEWLR